MILWDKYKHQNRETVLYIEGGTYNHETTNNFSKASCVT